MTVAGREQVRPAGVDADTDRLTTPENPFNAERVTVELPDVPARAWGGVAAPADIVKSPTLNAIVAVV